MRKLHDIPPRHFGSFVKCPDGKYYTIGYNLSPEKRSNIYRLPSYFNIGSMYISSPGLRKKDLLPDDTEYKVKGLSEKELCSIFMKQGSANFFKDEPRYDPDMFENFIKRRNAEL